jgi:hypothetical protein
MLTSTPDHQNTASRATLPAELVSKIITCLQHDRKYATLATMALANSTFYDLVIPKLYETIIITETNWKRLRIGHGDRNLEYVELKALNMFLSTARAGDGTCPHRQLGEGGPPTRKDKAVRHCRRLIIDIGTSLFSTMFALNQRWVCQAYGAVEEVIITRHNLESDRSGASLGLPPDDSPCIVWPGMDVKTITPRRFVMYAPIRPRGAVSQQINVFHRSRQEDRYFLSCHGPTPDASLAYATLDIHFVPDYAMSRRDIAIVLTRWIVWDHRTSTNRKEFRIRLFDIPSLIIDEADRPKNNAEATELARRTLERMVNKHHTVAGRQKLVRGIMDRIDFMDSEDGDEEYPVLRPRAVSPIPHGSCSQS